MDLASIPQPGQRPKAAPAKVFMRSKARVADLGEEHESYSGLVFIFTATGMGQGATRHDPAYLLTRDALALRVTGLTGGKGLRLEACRHCSVQRHGRLQHGGGRFHSHADRPFPSMAGMGASDARRVRKLPRAVHCPDSFYNWLEDAMMPGESAQTEPTPQASHT